MGPIQRRPSSRRVPKKSTFQDCFAYDIPGLRAFRVKPRAANILNSTLITTGSTRDPPKKSEKTQTSDTSSSTRHTNTSSNSKPKTSPNWTDGRRLRNGKIQLERPEEPEKKKENLLESVAPVVDSGYWQPVVLLKRPDKKMYDNKMYKNLTDEHEPKSSNTNQSHSKGFVEQRVRTRKNDVARHPMPEEVVARRTRACKDDGARHQTHGEIEAKRRRLEIRLCNVELRKKKETEIARNKPPKLTKELSQKVKTDETYSSGKLQDPQPEIHANTCAEEEMMRNDTWAATIQPSKINDKLHDKVRTEESNTSGNLQDSPPITRACAEEEFLVSEDRNDNMDWSSIHVVRLIKKMESMNEATTKLFHEIISLKKFTKTKHQENKALKQELETYESNKLYQTVKQVVNDANQASPDEESTSLARSILGQLELYAELKSKSGKGK